MSYENSTGVRDFILKRMLRIFPGLAVVVFLTVFVVGPVFTVFPPLVYFSDIRAYSYLSNVFLFRMQDSLPGVFYGNPLPNNVNGSLWTLWYEFVCYLGALGLGVIGQLRWQVILFIMCTCFFLTVNWAGVPVMWRVNDYLSALRWQADYLELIPYFACGSLLYLLRDKILLSPMLALAAFMILLLTLRTPFYKQVFSLAGSYLIIYIAFSPWLRSGGFSKNGDFSYGIYIYAYPVQQGVNQYLMPNVDWLTNFIISFPIVLLCAVASWHWVESPALAMKKKINSVLIRG